MPEAGQTLSHYRLIEKIGEGGMGVVWRAEDTKLRRDVALKFLPEGIARDPDRLVRFEREARMLAALNDSNVAAIHEMDHAEGEQFLVLEYVPGVSLAERLKKGALPVKEALKICCDLARGLEAAHAKGMIHRDLKPANVQLTPEGKVKVLDFGLAKALGDVVAADERSQQMTVTAATGEYTVVGTVPYMSPEQAAASPVDKRTDIWAFGCILYELLTGQRTFAGETVSNTLTKIQGQDPDWEQLPAETPAAVHRLLHRCLEKDADRRLHDIADARIVIEDALAGRDWAMASSVSDVRRRPWAIVGAAALAILMGALGGIGIWSRLSSSTSEAVTLSTTSHLSFDPGQPAAVTGISPDGQKIAFNAGGNLHIRHLDRPEAELIEASGVGFGVSFSPDGRWLAFTSRDSEPELFKVRLDEGGSPMSITKWGEQNIGNAAISTLIPATMAWLWNGDIVGISRGPERIVRVPASAGTPDATVELVEQGNRWYAWSALPRSSWVLAERNWTDDRGAWRLSVGLIDTESGATRVLIEDGAHPIWSSMGHVLFTRWGSLFAAPFDPERLELEGPPVDLGVGIGGGKAWSPGRFFVSNTGTLVHHPAHIFPDKRQAGALDREGNFEPWFDEPQALFGHVVTSADGRRVALTTTNLELQRHEVLVGEKGHGGLRRLGAEPGMECKQPLLSPDGGLVVYHCQETEGRPDGGRPSGLYVRRFDGSDEPTLLLEGLRNAASFAPDGSALLLGGKDILLLGMQPDSSGSRPMTILLERRASWPRFSPDGRWIAYSSDEAGGRNVFIRRLRSDHSLGPPIQVSRRGGHTPVWFATEQEPVLELSYITESNLDRVVVSISQNAELFISEPTQVVGWGGGTRFNVRIGDALPDGQLFVVQKGEGEDDSRIIVVQNWFAEMKRTLAAAQ